MMRLMPWGKTEEAVRRLEAEVTAEALGIARSALDDLAKRQAIPGVKKKAAELEARWISARARVFDAVAESGDHAAAAFILSTYPIESLRVDETLRLAALALAAGAEPPSLTGIPAGGVKWEQRSVYYAISEREAATAGDWARSRELLALWIQHAPGEPEPHARLVKQYLLHGENERAIAHFPALDVAMQNGIADTILECEELPRHGRAYLLIQCGRAAAARGLLDAILASEPSDAWALSRRIALAESEGDVATARPLYERLTILDPANPAHSRRLAEFAHHAGDAATAVARYREAWNLGDIGAGIALARLLSTTSRDEAAEVAGNIARGAAVADDVYAAGVIFLDLEESAAAAAAFRRSFRMDRLHADRVIAASHAFAEKHERDRLPLLEFLAEVGPVRGYSSDPYNLMRADDLIRDGRPLEARPLLEELIDSSLRWKAFAALARMVLSESAGAKVQMMERIDAVIPEADRAGRSVSAELRYYAAVLCDEAGRTDEAVKRFEELLAREFQYRDAQDRLERLRAPTARYPVS
jgi:tetratricopeptide (TPR) repeat protein